MKYRKLRIAWSVAWGIACLLLVALWMRSYWWAYHAQYVHANKTEFEVDSAVGRISFTSSTPQITPYAESEVWSGKIAPEYKNLPGLGFYIGELLGSTQVVIPHWFTLLFAGSIAGMPWIRWRFSLRTLLIAMTVAAIGLGWAVYALRN